MSESLIKYFTEPYEFKCILSACMRILAMMTLPKYRYSTPKNMTDSYRSMICAPIFYPINDSTASTQGKSRAQRSNGIIPYLQIKFPNQALYIGIIINTLFSRIIGFLSFPLMIPCRRFNRYIAGLHVQHHR